MDKNTSMPDKKKYQPLLCRAIYTRVEKMAEEEGRDPTNMVASIVERYFYMEDLKNKG